MGKYSGDLYVLIDNRFCFLGHMMINAGLAINAREAHVYRTGSRRFPTCRSQRPLCSSRGLRDVHPGSCSSSCHVCLPSLDMASLKLSHPGDLCILSLPLSVGTQADLHNEKNRA